MRAGWICQHNCTSVSARNWTPLELFPSYSWITIRFLGSELCAWGEALGGNACLSAIPQPQGPECDLSEGDRKISICWPASKSHKSDSLLLLEIGWPHCQLNCGWPVPGEQSDQVQLVKVRHCLNEPFFNVISSRISGDNHSRIGAHSVDSRLVLPWILALWLISRGQDRFYLDSVKVVKNNL